MTAGFPHLAHTLYIHLAMREMGDGPHLAPSRAYSTHLAMREMGDGPHGAHGALRAM